MDCARCGSKMLRHDVPLPDGGTAWVDRCASAKSCGVWYDGRELPALHPAFLEGAVRNALAAAQRVAVDAALAIACPRCESRPPLAPVLFVGVTLDACESCQGVWVDRDEVAALMNALHTHAPGLRAAPAHYRSAPVTPSMNRKNEPFARCVRCRVEFPSSEALYTERGFMCFACGSEHARAE
jgi:Zn-finger nucleic acid-binding protein